MIQKNTILFTSDNSGLLTVKCCGFLKGTKKKYAVLNEFIIVSGQKYIKKKKQLKFTTKIFKGILIHLKKKIKRLNGHYIKSTKNKIITLDKLVNNLIGTKIKTPIRYELFLLTKINKYKLLLKQIKIKSPYIL